MLQVILNVIDLGMNVQEAVDFPRVHHQWLPDTFLVDRGVSPDAVDRLRARGHKVTRGWFRWNDADEEMGPPDRGIIALIVAIVRDGGWLQGAADRRGDGKAVGY